MQGASRPVNWSPSWSPWRAFGAPLQGRILPYAPIDPRPWLEVAREQKREVTPRALEASLALRA